MRHLRIPVVYFALGGALLFALGVLVERSRVGHRAMGVTGTSAAPSRTVSISTAEIDALRATFRAGWKREPTSAEVADLLLATINEEILFREGLARGVDRDDRVVRRRIVEKTTALVRPTAPTSDPSGDQLRRWYQTYSHRFVHPVEATFDQLFFDPKRHADPDAAARAVLATLVTTALSDAPPPGVGDAFAFPGRMADKSEVELAHLYGEGFARAVMAAPVGRWQGPLTSRYGTHLVRVDQHRTQRLPAFEEAERFVRADWLTVEMRGQRAAAESLLPRYEIVLPAEARAQLGKEPSLAPFMRQIR